MHLALGHTLFSTQMRDLRQTNECKNIAVALCSAKVYKPFSCNITIRVDSLLQKKSIPNLVPLHLNSSNRMTTIRCNYQMITLLTLSCIHSYI